MLGARLISAYKTHAHSLRGILTFILVVGSEVASTGADVAAGWTKRQWITHVSFAACAGLVARMRAGSLNPAPPAQQPSPPAPLKED